ncbi:MAG: MFS transporter [Roseibium sp.]|uniref:MFS transporter n=1 Tax=Roseibium sp. TaxID=1936156 RepID=UPI001B0B1315|nr:MFS transporter [Roseibium sp.]MBO6893778.1 MFS transporter [Roseibium sp.]MBO6933152.1 MFS transporter [Roseibium sp.]
MSLANRICLIFFLQPIALGAWLPHIPGVQTSLGLSNSELAVALVGAPVGTLVTLVFAGRLANRFGARSLVRVLYPVFLIAMLLPFVAGTQFQLMAALACVGSSMSILELGLNVLADEHEKRTTDKIMSKAHGFWSFGLLTGTLIGSLVAGVRFEPLYAGLLIALIVQATVVWVTADLPDDRGESPEATQHHAFQLPHPLLIGICVFTFGTTMIEGAIADWAAVFLRDAFAANPGVAGLGIAVFSLCLATTRLFGDRLRQSVAPGRLGQFLALIGLAGLGGIWIAPNTMTALVGLGVLGIGAALAFPLGVTAAAAAPGRSAASNVAVLSFIALLGFLVGPLSIGVLADAHGIRTGLMILVPMICLSFLLAPLLTVAQRHEKS